MAKGRNSCYKANLGQSCSSASLWCRFATLLHVEPSLDRYRVWTWSKNSLKVGKMMGAQDTSRKTLRNASILRTPLHRIPLADTQKGTQNHHCRVVPLQKNRANEKLGRWKPIFLSPLLLAAILTATAAAEDVIEPFESAQVSWQLVEEDCSPRVIIHQRTTQQRHGGCLLYTSDAADDP